MPVLYYEAGDGAGRKVEFSDTVVLGRLKTAAVPIPDPEASREHTRVVREAGGWFAVDCGSRNGTEVNGSKVTRHALRNGDRIRIAKTVLRFEDPATGGGPGSASGADSAPEARQGIPDRPASPGAKTPVDPAPCAPPPVPVAERRPSGRLGPPAPPSARPSGGHAPPVAPQGPPRPHAPPGPSGATQAAVYALLALLFVGFVFLSRWIAGLAIDRMVESQRQEQPK
ncbi:MAG: FHA domain-containing protein [Planctomycetes bacterium]|nr:FHA domain-containing protein [Planctomycetota bacterium]